MDAIIYETAKRENVPVLTGDEHFKGIENIIYIKKSFAPIQITAKGMWAI